MLGLPKWRLEMKSQMMNFFYYMNDINLDDIHADLITEGMNLLTGTRSELYAVIKKNVENIFKKYQKLEITSLLELALWKANIVDNIFFSSMAEMREYSILEPTFHVDEHVKEKKITCGSSVVIPLVCSFLQGGAPACRGVDPIVIIKS